MADTNTSSNIVSSTLVAAAPTTTGAVLPPVEAAPDAAVVAAAASASHEHEPTPLTSKFTDAEWAALKKLRSELPAAFAEAYPDDPDGKSKQVQLWGVSIDPANPAADARVSVILMKFLRARALDTSSAKAMLVDTLKWRKTFDVDGLMNETFDTSLFGPLAQIYGKDKGGRPVTYNIYGGNKDTKAVFSDVQRFVRWRVQFMEQSIGRLDLTNVDQLVQVHDYEGVSMSSRDANTKAAASECSKIFQDHYPEFLTKKFFVNVPSFMAWIFWAFKPFLSSATFAKMAVVGPGAAACGKAMLPVIPAAELPRRYGGEAEGWPVEAKVQADVKA